jgi:hypothetical protein
MCLAAFLATPFTPQFDRYALTGELCNAHTDRKVGLWLALDNSCP